LEVGFLRRQKADGTESKDTRGKKSTEKDEEPVAEIRWSVI